MYNAPFVPFPRFNNTLVTGGLAAEQTQNTARNALQGLFGR
jgi:hypothetical protein